MKRLIARTSLLLVIGAAAITLPSVPAAAAASDNFPPDSPGVCNMLHVSAQGYAGMLKASTQGSSNMVTLVVANCPG